MSEIVFILGAGASREAGAPLMGDFLDQAENLMARNQVSPECRQDFERVFNAIWELQRLPHKSNIDLDNLESVFATLEMAHMIGKLADLKRPEIKRILNSMSVLICETLCQTLQFGVDTDRLLVPPFPYGAFADRVNQLDSDHSESRCSIITFNYDLALDYALAHRDLPIDYGLDNQRDSDYAVPLLKLHGSLNWVVDGGHTIQRHLKRRYGLPAHVLEKRSAHLHVRTTKFVDPPDFKYDPTKHLPFIVPPTWNKSGRGPGLTRVWTRAARELESAKYIVVCGYSLPETDMFFRYLFALGLLGHQRIHQFVVADPDPKVEARFRQLVGPHIERCFEFLCTRFGPAVSGVGGAPPDAQGSARFREILDLLS